MTTGKQASEGEAVAPMAAGVALQAMRRRVRLSRLVALTAIAAGPVALGVAITPASTAVQAATPAKPATVRTAGAADPAGYAQLFVSSWLRSSADDPTSAQARLAQSMARGVDLRDPAAGAQAKPEFVAVVRSAQRGDGTWSVTVAAQFAGGSVRYYAVPVAADRSGTSFAVTGAPGVVAGPARAKVPASAYRVSVPEGDLSSAVGEFLAAYLTGAGEVDRYLAPGVRMLAVSPAPYRTVTVQQVLAAEEAAAAGQVPGDGTTVRVLAQVEARGEDGRWPLGYELVLRARSGRWEVAALESGASQTGGRS
ncbi:conjugal transfer protein [Streptomyces sp. NPDC020800]|uniref:conjugal transfer protein n=1 Tax=Streptomyces sp. NPDC020800 TaxID=3365092 RepID=UPI00379A04C1